jgi:hypothetical protein
VSLERTVIGDPLPADLRDALLSSVREGLRGLGDIDKEILGGAKIQVRVHTDEESRWRDGTWLVWLPNLYPELAGEPEPYEVPDDLEGPETVPWLTARTMGGMNIERWWQHVFTYEHADCSLAALILFREEGDLPRTQQPLTDWAKKATKTEQARLWNKVMKRLGYTEDV